VKNGPFLDDLLDRIKTHVTKNAPHPRPARNKISAIFQLVVPAPLRSVRGRGQKKHTESLGGKGTENRALVYKLTHSSLLKGGGNKTTLLQETKESAQEETQKNKNKNNGGGGRTEEARQAGVNRGCVRTDIGPIYGPIPPGLREPTRPGAGAGPSPTSNKKGQSLG